MGNSTSVQTREAPPPPTPASSFFNLTTNPPTRQRTRKRASQPHSAFPRQSIFHPDEDEPDDFAESPSVLLGWTRTEQGVVIPQIRSIPIASPLDDTIFNSPRLPWVERRSGSPAPSARSIPRMRQFSIESLRSTTKRELRVVNHSRPATATSLPNRRFSVILADEAEDEDESEYEVEYESRAPSFEWQAKEVINESQQSGVEKQPLKRFNSTNDSGYSSMNPDTGSETDGSVDPWWWEEAAGYTISSSDPQVNKSLILTLSTQAQSATKSPSPPSTIRQHHHRNSSLTPSVFSTSSSSTKTRTCSTKLTTPSEPTPQALQYLYSERQESFHISTLLRNHPIDEWSEWSEKVTNLLMIPEEVDNLERSDTPPQTPRAPIVPAIIQQIETPRSPTRRKSLFNFARVAKMGLSKRK